MRNEIKEILMVNLADKSESEIDKLVLECLGLVDGEINNFILDQR